PRAAGALCEALRAICAAPDVDVVVLARGGGSFEDLLPFSDERVVRAVAACPVPVVSAVGHEQDTPLCDLAADVRASTPTAAARLVVPDLGELVASLERSRAGLERGVRRSLERHRERLRTAGARLAGACALAARDPRPGLRDRPLGGRPRPLRRGARGGRPGRRRAGGGVVLGHCRRGAAVTDGEPTFEAAEAELTRIVEQLERGNVPLEEAMSLWQRGEELYRLCRARLDALEGEVEELARRMADAGPAV